MSPLLPSKPSRATLRYRTTRPSWPLPAFPSWRLLAMSLFAAAWNSTLGSSRSLSTRLPSALLPLLSFLDVFFPPFFFWPFLYSLPYFRLFFFAFFPLSYFFFLYSTFFSPSLFTFFGLIYLFIADNFSPPTSESNFLALRTSRAVSRLLRPPTSRTFASSSTT